MKKITILALHDGVGGAEKYISLLCQMLNEEFKIEIIFTYRSKNKIYDFPKAKIKYLINDISNRKEFIDSLKKHNWIKCLKEGLKSLKLLYLKRNLNIKAIKNSESDYIITTRAFHNKLVGKYAPKKALKIATEHNHHNNEKKYIKKTLRCIKNLDYFVLVSKELYEFYKDKTNIKCLYIPNTYDIKIDEKSKLNSDKLISVGRLSPEKGYLDLIEVMKKVNEQDNEIEINLIGDGPQRELIVKKIRDYNLENKVHLLGFLNSNEIAKILKDSTLFIMTSYTESFGIVLLEAMEAGVVPIAFDSVQGACEVLEEDKDLLIPNRDINLMTEKILYYLKHKDMLKEKVLINNERKNKYTLKEVKKKWLNLLEKR